MKYGWVDSHCHLTDEDFLIEIEDILKRATNNEVVDLMVVCTSIEDAKKALKLQEKYHLDLAVGFHPEDADNIDDEKLKELEDLLKTGHFKALGEIGLDYHFRDDNKEKQKDLFIKQIKIADKYQLPIIIHTRDAAEDTFKIIKDNPNQRKGVMHCYTGSVELAKEYLKLGFYISMAGPVTFKNAVNPKAVAKIVPLERILVETDCPYMTPVPFRGLRNEPMYVVYTAREVALLKGISDEQLQAAVYQNYHRLFD